MLVRPIFSLLLSEVQLVSIIILPAMVIILHSTVHFGTTFPLLLCCCRFWAWLLVSNYVGIRITKRIFLKNKVSLHFLKSKQFAQDYSATAISDDIL